MLLAMLTSLCGLAAAATEHPAAPTDPKGPLDFTLTDIDGKPYPLSQHKGKVILLINVASKCGLTPQYTALQTLYSLKKDKGLILIGIPANEFGGQEPGSETDIKTFCSSKYAVTFPLMSKAVVKGDGITPLYNWLTTKSPFPGPIKWNFNKFLIGRDGAVKARFEPKVTPDDKTVTEAIDKELAVEVPKTK